MDHLGDGAHPGSRLREPVDAVVVGDVRGLHGRHEAIAGRLPGDLLGLLLIVAGQQQVAARTDAAGDGLAYAAGPDDDDNFIGLRVWPAITRWMLSDSVSSC
ncbi:hypothetical protein Slala03_72000 [Streptomyces lavendulae subsp. lavendulae]|uniref:hypothetical protein n=1 Tax=Streptomyces lavendulae TaxID=1914 RepID=UPI0024A4848A|nr:hypothetical protein [Streptomyces lavendulae]GLV87511.1 hypothetical protein Slala03_72000 [Streptomyces lavendulae subsp. lavendulae]